jgi:ABC-2 type transport system permease protein
VREEEHVMNLQADQGHLPVRDGAHLAHADAEHRVAGAVSTSLYFVVFGAAIGSRIPEVGGVSYGAFIVPGLIMLSLLTQSISNASFGIYFPKFTGTIYELLSAPVSTLEIVLAYVGAAATKSICSG